MPDDNLLRPNIGNTDNGRITKHDQQHDRRRDRYLGQRFVGLAQILEDEPQMQPDVGEHERLEQHVDRVPHIPLLQPGLISGASVPLPTTKPATTTASTPEACSSSAEMNAANGTTSPCTVSRPGLASRRRIHSVT